MAAAAAAITHWLAMGGYAEYVWPAYAITAVGLGGVALHSWRWYRISSDAVERLQRGGGGAGAGPRE